MKGGKTLSRYFLVSKTACCAGFDGSLLVPSSGLWFRKKIANSIKKRQKIKKKPLFCLEIWYRVNFRHRTDSFWAPPPIVLMSTPANPNLAPTASLEEVAGTLAELGVDPTPSRVEQVHAVVVAAEIPARLERSQVLGVLVQACLCRETLETRLGEAEAQRILASSHVRALSTARIFEVAEPVQNAVGFESDAAVTDGVVRWNSNGRVPPQEILDLWAFLGKPFDPAKSTEARVAETKQFLADYRAQNDGRKPGDEELAEMRANFGPDARVVNVVTGDRYDLRTGQVSSPLPTKSELQASITEQFKRIQALLQDAIQLPDGHTWNVPRDQLKWFLGCPIESVSSGASFFITKQWDPSSDADARVGDPAQVSAEIRVFLPEQHYTSGKGTLKFRAFAGPLYSSHIWVSSGPQWAGQSTDHVTGSQRYPKGQTLEELVTAIAQSVNPCLEAAASSIFEDQVYRLRNAIAEIDENYGELLGEYKMEVALCGDAGPGQGGTLQSTREQVSRLKVELSALLETPAGKALLAREEGVSRRMEMDLEL
ncbi:hypothetical protein [Ralstonia sp. ASV6]|uniref:hypothetical protein n=1 Tax=Ralstonia sp. ASV6 TaxID=2795124 RepID=UPI0018ED11B7|nr:hypothetical protein [Ralstonia sp. ASV6]